MGEYFFQCECCKRRLPSADDYFGHIRTHPLGDLARRVEPRLFGGVPDITQYAKQSDQRTQEDRTLEGGSVT